MKDFSFFNNMFSGWFNKKEEKRPDWWIEWVLFMGVKEDRETIEKKYEEFIKIQRRNYLKRKKYASRKAKTAFFEWHIARYNLYSEEEKIKKSRTKKEI